jgi:hypothetical protein
MISDMRAAKPTTQITDSPAGRCAGLSLGGLGLGAPRRGNFAATPQEDEPEKSIYVLRLAK